MNSRSPTDVVFRLTTVGTDGETTTSEFLAEDDTTASVIAEGWFDGRPMSLWKSGRLVARWS